MFDKSLQPNEICRCRFANIFTAKKDSENFMLDKSLQPNLEVSQK